MCTQATRGIAVLAWRQARGTGPVAYLPFGLPGIALHNRTHAPPGEHVAPHPRLNQGRQHTTTQRGETTMGADHRSDIDPARHNRDTNDMSFLHDDTSLRRMPPRAEPAEPGGTDDSEHSPETVSDDPVWCYDQPAKNRHGKHRIYIGRVNRMGGTEGKRIRRELAATIYDLLVWAKQQQETDTTRMDSGEEGGSR